jgi:TRAP-type uncharacterized transport system substrate-binding protein
MFKPVIQAMDPLLLGIFGTIVAALVAFGLWTAIDRSLIPRRLVYAAGNPTGESYQIGEALKAAIESRLSWHLFGLTYQPVTIDLTATGGTEENLRLLEGGAADFAAAQADIISDYSDDLATTHARVAAVLFVDRFQLLTCGPGAVSFDQLLARLRDGARVEQVYVPLTGGQRRSFEHIAKHFGLVEGVNYALVDSDRTPPGTCGGDRQGDIIFRVRIAGNSSIAANLSAGWSLVPLSEIEAMQLKNAALRADLIPLGTYHDAQGRAVPDTDLQTISVQRIFLANDRVPDWLVYEVVSTLNQESGALAASMQRASGDAYTRDYVIPLLASIPTLNSPDELSRIGVPLHPGAYQFYQPNESWFAWANNNSGVIGLGLTLVTVAGSLFLAVNRWIKLIRKDTADRYLRELNFLKERAQSGTPSLSKISPEVIDFNRRLEQKLAAYRASFGPITTEELPPDNRRLDAGLISSLILGVGMLDQINEVFSQASRALENDQISEESFRTFNQTYRSTLEAIEERNEKNRRAISLHYVTQTMKLLDVGRERVATRESLDFIRTEAARVMTNELVFSRESFRTLVEAYTLAREAVSR